MTMGLAHGRPRTAAVSAVLCGIAVTAASTVTGCGEAAHHARPAAVAAAHRAGLPAVINCLNRAQVRPPEFVLTCADGWDYLYRLHWATEVSTPARQEIPADRDVGPMG
jgi:hypothetical protein